MKNLKLFFALTIMVMFVMTSCGKKENITVQDAEISSFKTDKEVIQFFEDLDINSLEASYVDYKVETLPSVAAKMQTCEVEGKVYLYGSTNTCDVNIYINGSSSPSNTYYGLNHLQSFTIPVSESDTYRFTITPTGNTSNVDVNLKVGPVNGIPTIFSFSGSGTHSTHNMDFDCPTPTNGNCDIDVCLDLLSGSPSSTLIVVFKNGVYIDHEYLQDDACFTLNIDDPDTYHFYVCPMGNTTNVAVRLTLLTANNLSMNYLFSSSGYTDHIDFECP